MGVVKEHIKLGSKKTLLVKLGFSECAVITAGHLNFSANIYRSNEVNLTDLD